MKRSIYLLSSMLFTFYIGALQAQTFRVDSIYKGEKGYVEYLPGNMPLIFAASHGGDLAPTEIPTRSCAGCVTSTDLNTQELVRQLREAVFRASGCYPHVIINRLRRSKLDANREIVEAALGNPDAEQAWKAYHGFLDAAKQQIETNSTRGLFVDIHGHGHTIQRLELGYLLSGSTLRLSDASLNSAEILDNTSIRQLVTDNLQKLSHAQLIRGDFSLGSLLEKEGYAAVPSTADPAPRSGQDYFSGGYSTERHGSAFNGNIDAIQIECNFQGVRDTEVSREFFAASLTKALLEYLKVHYYKDLPSCQTITSLSSISNNPVYVFPNPGCGTFNLDGLPNPATVAVYDMSGRSLLEHSTSTHTLELPVNQFPNGLYWLIIQQPNQSAVRIPLLQQCPE